MKLKSVLGGAFALAVLGVSTLYSPLVVRAETDSGSGAGWTSVSTSSKRNCAAEARKKFLDYQSTGELVGIRFASDRASTGVVQAWMPGRDVMFVALCSPSGNAVYVYNACPKSICQQRRVIDLRNELGEYLRW